MVNGAVLREWSVPYARRRPVNGGSELLIFLPRAAHSQDLSLSLSLVGRARALYRSRW